MERDEIIEIARQAGLEDTDFPFDEWEPVELIAFAKLVAEAAASKEREACAKIVEVEAMQYSEPVWAFEIVNDIRARGEV